MKVKMLLNEIPVEFLDPWRLGEVGKEVFGPGISHLASSSGATRLIDQPQPLIDRAVTSSTFGVWKVNLARGDETKIVMLKICGNDPDEDKTHISAASDIPSSYTYWKRDALVYQSPQLVKALCLPRELRIKRCYGFTPEMRVHLPGVKAVASSVGMWLEFVPKLTEGPHAQQIFVAAAQVLGTRDAELVARLFLPRLKTTDSDRVSLEYDWLAKNTNRDFYEQRAIQSRYDIDQWIRYANGTDRLPFDLPERLAARSVTVWKNRTKFYELLDSERRIKILNFGDFIGQNYDVAMDDGKPIIVMYDLANVGCYPIGCDIMNLAYSAIGTWRPTSEYQVYGAKNVAEFLYEKYRQSLVTRLEEHGLTAAVGAVQKQLRENFAASWALKVNLFGDMLDPDYMERFATFGVQELRNRMIAGIEVAVQYGEEALELIAPPRLELASL